MTWSAISLGDVIGGRYQIESVLGQGGMAIVYEARHAGTGKACALKIVHPHLVSRPELVDMFVREARVAGRIGDHPYVVNVFDAGEDEARHLPFMAMELLQGQTIEQFLEARTPMSWPLVQDLLEQLAEALDQAHGAGIIHRDLKPGNLFLTKDYKGHPLLKVMDFGIAKILELEAQGTTTHVGSPIYAAPEQQAGDAVRRLAANHGITIAREVSPATDVWAIGLIAYELLTGLSKGQVWGTFETINDLLIKVALEATPVPSARAGERASLLPHGFDEWFDRCLQKAAPERWSSARQAVEELIKLLRQSLPGSRAAQPSLPLATPGGAGMPGQPRNPTPTQMPLLQAAATPAAAHYEGSVWTPLVRSRPKPRSNRVLALGLSAMAFGLGLVLFFVSVGRREELASVARPTTADVAAVVSGLPPVGNDAPEETGELIDPPSEESEPAPEKSSSVEPTATASASEHEVEPLSAKPGQSIPKTAQVFVSSPGKTCSVTINGKPAGETPLAKRVAPGKLRISCLSSSAGPRERTVEAQPGKLINVSFVW